MRELSLHILDLAENAVAAGATRIRIRVKESSAADRLTIEVEDNGCGMPAEKRERLDDPFVTTRRSRRVGLGLPLLWAAARRCDGDLTVANAPGGGTFVAAEFRRSHIDRAPLGDIAATLGTLLAAHPDIDFTYCHAIDEESFELSTRELRAELGDRFLGDPLVVHHLAAAVRRALNRLTPATGGSSAREEPDGQTHP
jgi:hypothetical protein